MAPGQFEIHPNPKWVCDRAETRIIACNDAACQFLGQPRQKPASGLTCQNAGAVTANLARNLPATRALPLAETHSAKQESAVISSFQLDWPGGRSFHTASAH